MVAIFHNITHTLTHSHSLTCVCMCMHIDTACVVMVVVLVLDTSLIGLVHSLLSAVSFQESNTRFLLLSFIFNGGISFALFSTKDFNGF